MKVCPSCGLEYPDEERFCFVDKAALETVVDRHLGSILKGRYRIESKIGEGGMATVYRATGALVQRPVAVKIMSRRLIRDMALRERFRREAKNAAAVAHPNIIAVLDHGEMEDGTPFLVMELLDGESLDEIIAEGPIRADRAAALGVQIARGLARAHDFSVLHRDLKPENIFICRDDHGELSVVKILDFGIARSMHDQRLTSAGEIFGTPQYMAPERVTSIDAGPSADLYALGVILFEMVTGTLPFHAEQIPGYFVKHMTEDPPRPSSLVADLPAAFEALILHLLEKKPEDRPVDAHAVTHRLEELAPNATYAVLPAANMARASRSSVSAPTLPPTSLEQWAHRAAIFSEMLEQAALSGPVAPALIGALNQIRDAVACSHELRRVALDEQRKLEAVEAETQEARERLGHAVHVLGEDLSAAREAVRKSEREVQPFLEADAAASGTYRGAFSAYHFQTGGGPAQEPTDEVVRATRALADALERWRSARAGALEVRSRAVGKAHQVQDLEFQVDALRGQLTRLEAHRDEQRASVESSLEGHGMELARLEQELIRLGTAFVMPLRSRPELRSLFARLERESGTPAAGLARA